jgi:hypothetical protein
MGYYTVVGCEVRFSNGTTVGLDAPVAQALDFGDMVVVRLEVPPDRNLNENVLGVHIGGRIAWQIPPVRRVYQRSLYTNMWRESDALFVYNWDGSACEVNPRTGSIERSWFMK